MKRAAFLIFISLFIFCINSRAQKAAVSCPYIRINSFVDESSLGPFKDMRILEDAVCPGTVVIFAANVTGLDPKVKPTFRWVISDGEILSGQGTSSIKVQTHLKHVEATVEIVGLTKQFSSCPLRLSKTVRVAACCLLPESPCVLATIKSHNYITNSDKFFTATARLNHPELEERIRYVWTITDGVILEGEGTKTIKAKCVGVESCVVELDIKGIAPECPSKVSETIKVSEDNSTLMFDSYGDLSFDNEKKRLDLFAAKLIQRADTEGYIVVYSRSDEITEDIIERVDRAKFYLVENRNIDFYNVKVIYGGYRDTFITELWISPRGVRPPLSQSK